MKFKKGDIVVGSKREHNPYAITVKGWKGKVLGYEGNILKLQGLNGGIKFNVGEEYFDLVKKGAKPSPVNFVVFYDKEHRDPMETFSTLEEVKEWIVETQSDSDIDFSSIRVFEVKRELQVKTEVTLF